MAFSLIPHLFHSFQDFYIMCSFFFFSSTQQGPKIIIRRFRVRLTYPPMMPMTPKTPAMKRCSPSTRACSPQPENPAVHFSPRSARTPSPSTRQRRQRSGYYITPANPESNHIARIVEVPGHPNSYGGEQRASMDVDINMVFATPPSFLRVSVHHEYENDDGQGAAETMSTTATSNTRSGSGSTTTKSVQSQNDDQLGRGNIITPKAIFPSNSPGNVSGGSGSGHGSQETEEALFVTPKKKRSTKSSQSSTIAT